MEESDQEVQICPDYQGLRFKPYHPNSNKEN